MLKKKPLPKREISLTPPSFDGSILREIAEVTEDYIAQEWKKAVVAPSNIWNKNTPDLRIFLSLIDWIHGLREEVGKAPKINKDKYAPLLIMFRRCGSAGELGLRYEPASQSIHDEGFEYFTYKLPYTIGRYGLNSENKFITIHGESTPGEELNLGDRVTFTHFSRHYFPGAPLEYINREKEPSTHPDDPMYIVASSSEGLPSPEPDNPGRIYQILIPGDEKYIWALEEDITKVPHSPVLPLYDSFTDELFRPLQEMRPEIASLLEWNSMLHTPTLHQKEQKILERLMD